MQRGTYRIVPVKAPKCTVFALVSPEDYEWAKAYRWYLHTGGYAIRNRPASALGPRRVIRMHREILGLGKGGGRTDQCDHINRDRLDNRRENLRVVTASENSVNRDSPRGSKSRHRGVSWMPIEQLWRARARLDSKTYSLGTYRSEREAAEAVNRFWTTRGYDAPNDLAA